MCERIDHVDIFKSIGIILMIMGHIRFGDVFDHWESAFNMPMFFFISGYLFNHKTKIEIPFLVFVKNKARSLLIPYIFFGLFHFLLVFIKYRDFSPLLGLISINTDNLPIAGALWFLTALFFTDVFYFLLDRYIQNKILFSAIVFLLAVFGNLCSVILPFELPFALGPSLVGLGLFHIGNLLKTYENNKIIHFFLNLNIFELIGIGIVATALVFLNGPINMRIGFYSIIPLFWINSVLSISVMISFSKVILNVFDNSFIKKWLISIGKNSIVYLCLNQLVIVLLKNSSGELSAKLLVLLETLFVLFIVGEFLLKTKLRLIIGRKL